jgi:hypothetical protein
MGRYLHILSKGIVGKILKKSKKNSFTRIKVYNSIANEMGNFISFNAITFVLWLILYGWFGYQLGSKFN